MSRILPPFTQGRPTVDFGRPALQVSDIDREMKTRGRAPYGGFAGRGANAGAAGSRGVLTERAESGWRPPSGSSGGAALKKDGQLRDVVVASCVTLGREQSVADRTVAYLESEWLGSAESLKGLSEGGWSELNLPLGLKEELKRRLQGGIAAARTPQATATAKASKPSNPYATAASVLPDAGRNATSSSSRMAYEGDGRRAFPAETERLLARLRAEFKKRGATGLKGLARRFEIMDNDHNRLINLDEFIIALDEMQLALSGREKELLFSAMDADGSGQASYDELVALLGPGLNERRRRAVRLVFEYLDATGDGTVQLDDLKLRYDPSVMAEQGGPFGRRVKPADEVLVQFVEGLRRRCGGSVAGVVFLEDFERYYEGVSANIDQDEYFEEMLKRAWGMPDGWLRNAPSGQRGLSGVAAGMPSAPQGFAPPPRSAAGMLQRLRSVRERDAGAPSNPYGQEGLRAHVPGAQRLRGAVKAMQAAKYLAHRGAPSWQGPSAVAPPQVLSAAADSPLMLRKGDFEAKVREIFPKASPHEVATLAAAFQDRATGDVDYQAFLSQLQRDVSPARDEIARALWEELCGKGAKEFDFTKAHGVPPGFREVMRDQESVTFDEWMAFHRSIAAVLPDRDDIYAAQLRLAWGLPAQPVADGRLRAGERHARYNGGYHKGVTSQFTFG